MEEKSRRNRFVEIFQHRQEHGEELPKLSECVYPGGSNDYDQMLALLSVKPDLAPHPSFECGNCQFDPVNTQHALNIKCGNVPAIAVMLFNAPPADFVGISHALLHNNNAKLEQLNKLLSR